MNNKAIVFCKLIVLSLCVIAITVFMSACSSGIAQESYDSLLNQVEALKASNKDVEEKISSYEAVVQTLQAVSQEYDKYQQDNVAELGAVKEEYASYKNDAEAQLKDAEKKIKEASEYKSSVEAMLPSVQDVLESAAAYLEEYAAYKESMSEYEGLAQAEAEARKIQAESIIESKAIAESQSIEASKEAASRAAEEEASRKAEEEKNAYDTGITYDQLARTPDDYEGKKVKFKGKVIQVLESDDEITIRFAVDSNYDNVIICAYEAGIVSSRVLEDDIITIYGTSIGLYTYTSSFGVPITIPAVWIDMIDQ